MCIIAKLFAILQQSIFFVIQYAVIMYTYTAQLTLMIYILNSLREEADFHLLVDFWWWFKTNEDIFRMIKTLLAFFIFINDWQRLMTATFDCLLIFKGQSIMKHLCSSLPDVPLYFNSHIEPWLFKFIHFTNSYILHKPVYIWFSSIVTFSVLLSSNISFHPIENVSGH